MGCYGVAAVYMTACADILPYFMPVFLFKLDGFLEYFVHSWKPRCHIVIAFARYPPFCLGLFFSPFWSNFIAYIILFKLPFLLYFSMR